jgi:hypothetical protein
VQGGGLQMGFRPSKALGIAIPTQMRLETGSNYLAQAKKCFLFFALCVILIKNKHANMLGG